jgi:hypothetical protein
MSKVFFAAVSLALAAGVNAQALTTKQTLDFSGVSNSVSDTVARTPSNPSQVSTATDRTLTFNKFQSSTGVLTGVSSSLSITGGSVTLSASGTQTGTGTPQFGSTGDVYARGFVGTTGSNNFLPAARLNETLSNLCNAGAPCFPSGVTNLSQNGNLTKTDSTWLSPTGSASAANLGTYAGTGSLLTTLRIDSFMTLDVGSASTFIASPRATQTITGLAGALSLDYSYLRHANASFSSGANMDERTIAAGSGFSIFNLGDASTTKLDYQGVSCSGDCGAFKVTLPTIAGTSWNVAAGNSMAGTTALTTGATSTSRATYVFTFKDDNAVGLANTQLTNTMQLTVAAVPEPSEWAMLAAGLLVIGFMARRRGQNPMV